MSVKSNMLNDLVTELDQISKMLQDTDGALIIAAVLIKINENLEHIVAGMGRARK